MQKTMSSQNRRSTKQFTPPKTMLVTSAIISMLSLSACQTVPTTPTTTSTQTSSTAATPTTTVTQAPVVDDYDYPVEIYVPSDQTNKAPSYPTQPIAPSVTSTSDNNNSAQNPLTQQSSTQSTTTQQLPDILSNNNSSVNIPIPDTMITAPTSDDYMISQPKIPPRNELLERARQNSQQQSRPTTSNNSSLPAFQNLMQSGIGQLKSGDLTAAESSFTRAQRLAPRSSAVYFYLAQVALKKNQPRKAEAMARRGLNVSQDTSRRRALWQLILRSGQLQNSPRVIREAQQALR